MGVYQERKWRYVKIAMVLILYDYTLLILTQVIQRLVDHFQSQQTLMQSNFVWDMVLLVWDWRSSTLTAFYGAATVVVHFDPSDKRFVLVAMRRP